MEHSRRPFTQEPASLDVPNPNWLASVFDAKASQRGGILRRAVRDVNREVGRAAFVAEVQRRGWHLIESGGQYVVFCHQGEVRIIC